MSDALALLQKLVILSILSTLISPTIDWKPYHLKLVRSFARSLCRCSATSSFRRPNTIETTLSGIQLSEKLTVWVRQVESRRARWEGDFHCQSTPNRRSDWQDWVTIHWVIRSWVYLLVPMVPMKWWIISVRNGIYSAHIPKWPRIK